MKAFIVALLALLLVGCSGFSEFVNKNEVKLQIATQVGVGKYIEAAPDQKERAREVLEVVSDGEAFISVHSIVTVDDFVELARKALNYNNMQISDRAIFDGIILYVTSEYDREVVTPDEVALFLSWVKQTANRY